MQIFRYGLKLKKTGEILGFYTEANPEDSESVSVTFHLESRSDCKRLWLVDNPEKAEHVKSNSTEWYNADYSTPSHSFSSEDLEVVCIKLEYE